MTNKESIEIPFGAKDSELKGWEYTIPEGMEAEIKDGKIIVREKESEDERIRETLTNYFKKRKSDGDEDEMWCGLSYDSIIAWLEKQGEEKPMKLIDKDALVAEIKDRLVFGSGALEIRRQEMQAGKDSSGYYKQYGVILAYNSIIKFLNTLDVKEVDLDEYLDMELSHYGLSRTEISRATLTASAVERIIRNAFELGLKVQKGE